MVILEAMAAKTPVVVTRTGGVGSMVKDGYNGFLVGKRNAKEIAEKVNLLLENEELCKKMGERSYQMVVTKFTWGRIADQFESIYKKHSYSTREYLSFVKGIQGNGKK